MLPNSVKILSATALLAAVTLVSTDAFARGGGGSRSSMSAHASAHARSHNAHVTFHPPVYRPLPPRGSFPTVLKGGLPTIYQPLPSVTTTVTAPTVINNSPVINNSVINSY